MKVKLMYLWNIAYYYEPGCPTLKTTIPTQVKAVSFDDAKRKVECFLNDFETGNQMRINGITLVATCPLE